MGARGLLQAHHMVYVPSGLVWTSTHARRTSATHSQDHHKHHTLSDSFGISEPRLWGTTWPQYLLCLFLAVWSQEV